MDLQSCFLLKISNECQPCHHDRTIFKTLEDEFIPDLVVRNYIAFELADIAALIRIDVFPYLYISFAQKLYAIVNIIVLMFLIKSTSSKNLNISR